MVSGYKRVFASLDGTKGERAIAQRAICIAANNGAHLCFGHVAEGVYSEATDEDMRRMEEREEADIRKTIGDLLEEAAADERIASVELCVKAGNLMETLHYELIDGFKPDLIVCRKKGMSGLRAVFAGSVSLYLVHHMDCDVLLVAEPK